MFKPGNMYRHRSSLDVDIYIVDLPDDYGDEVLLKVKYWHRNSKFFTPDTTTVDNIIVKKHHFENWKLV